MLTTILLSGLCGVALTVVLWVCIKWHKRNQGNPPGETITDSMVCKMLKEKKCNILEDPGNPEWILFEFEGNHYFIRMCGNYCELHAAMSMENSCYDPAITRSVCNNEMRNITCGHMWYDEASSRLLVTVFSIHKTYRHLKISFYDLLQCVFYMFHTFDEIYRHHTHSKETNNNDKVFS